MLRLELYIRDSYFAVAHTGILWFVAALHGVVAVVYSSFPALTRDSLNRTLGLIHFWATAATTGAVVAILFYVASGSYHQRDIDPLVGLMGEASALLVLGQVVFLGILVRSRGSNKVKNS